MGLFLIFHLDEPRLWVPVANGQLFLYALTFLSTFCFPVFCAFVLLKLKLIDSLEMRTKEERRFPYLASAIFYFSESYFLMRLDLPVVVQAIMMGATLLIVILMLINIFRKISAHMAGIGGLCGIILAVSYRLQISIPLTLISVFLVAGLVAYSRLRLNAHDPAEVYSGFFLGLLVQLIFLLTL